MVANYPLFLFIRRKITTILLSFILIIFCVWGSAWGIFYALPQFLAVNNPTNQGLLIVEGWLPNKTLEKAAYTYRYYNYDYIVVSGGPIEDNPCHQEYSTYAERAAHELKKIGIDVNKIIVASAPASAQDRTFRSSISVRQVLEAKGYKVTTFDLYSSGPHTRRSRDLYQIAFGNDVVIGTIAAAPTGYNYSQWWMSSAGVKEVLSETIAYLWTQCCFYPGKKGSWEEAWGSSKK